MMLKPLGVTDMTFRTLRWPFKGVHRPPNQPRFRPTHDAAGLRSAMRWVAEQGLVTKLAHGSGPLLLSLGLHGAVGGAFVYLAQPCDALAPNALPAVDIVIVDASGHAEQAAATAHTAVRNRKPRANRGPAPRSVRKPARKFIQPSPELQRSSSTEAQIATDTESSAAGGPAERMSSRERAEAGARMQAAWMNRVGSYIGSAARRHYPLEARRDRKEGSVMLVLQVDRAGRVLAVSLKRSSGHRILDRAALASVNGIQFVAPPPSRLAWRATALTVPIVYSLR